MKDKGFTLIELLAVIIILGILMIIAIPSVTSYINDSRKEAYVDTAKEIISGARNIVNEGKLGMYDTNTTYYIPAKYINTEGGEAKSPYGKLDEAYVGVTYNGTGYDYFWASRDDTGQGFNKIISNENLDGGLIQSDIEAEYVNDLVQKSAIGCNKNIKILNENGAWDDYVASEYVIDKKIFKGNGTCPNCVYTRAYNKSIYEGSELNIPTVNDYKELENYSSIPFMGITLKGNIIDTLHICYVADDNLVCLDGVYEGENFGCQSYMTANGINLDKFVSTRSEFDAAEEGCIKLYYTFSSNDSVPGINCKSNKYGYTLAYAKGRFINFFNKDNYICYLQITYSSSSDLEFGGCMQQ
jgi:prepilin-type N-terminal cleavage/methylation domain-containing protein